MKTVRFGLAVCIAFALAGSLYAKGQSESTSGSTAAKPVTISIWMGSWWQGHTSDMIQAFEKDHPNITVNIDLVPINGYLDKAITAVLGGSAPDMVALDASFIATMAGRNLLQPWDAYIKNLDMSDFNQAMVTAGTVNGKLYALPYRGSTGVYFYNKTMFSGAGLPDPKQGWTYQDMLAMAQKITVPGQKYGVGIAVAQSDPANVFSSFAPVLWAFGGDFLNADGTKAAINSPNAIKAITFWTDLYTKYHVVPEGSINFSLTKDVVPLFSANKIALFPGSSAQFDMLNSQQSLKFAAVVGPDGYNRGGGWAYAIPTNAPNADAARTFALWLVQPDILAKYLIRQPARASATNVPPWNSPAYQPFFAAGKWSKLTPITPAWNQMATDMITELQKILQGQETPTQGANNMATGINAALAAVSK